MLGADGSNGEQMLAVDITSDVHVESLVERDSIINKDVPNEEDGNIQQWMAVEVSSVQQMLAGEDTSIQQWQDVGDCSAQQWQDVGTAACNRCWLGRTAATTRCWLWRTAAYNGGSLVMTAVCCQG